VPRFAPYYDHLGLVCPSAYLPLLLSCEFPPGCCIRLVDVGLGAATADLLSADLFSDFGHIDDSIAPVAKTATIVTSAFPAGVNCTRLGALPGAGSGWLGVSLLNGLIIVGSSGVTSLSAKAVYLP
jgi:hypothetical protein